MAEGCRAATQILSRPDGTAVQVLATASLSVVKGDDKGKSLLMDREAIAVGADRSCDLVLTDPSVSARHFEIRSGPQGFCLTDLGSTNGTFVDELRVGSCFLDGPRVIRVGRTKVRFSPSKQTVEIPLSLKDRFGALLGQSPAMRRVFAVLERVAASDTTLLVEGESGTGKELVAESVHAASARAEGPLVVVDCGAIPENLVESELFGHEKGAFTGADRPRAGAFESASGGTLMLDEIGELPTLVQPKLLRALERREVKRVGADAPRKVDVRVVAATNRELEAEVAAGRFREDLYYRLAVLRVRLPPLRERREDIAPLVRHFVSKLRPGLEPDRAIEPQVVAMLERHDWPGNVRELRNVVERLLVFPELGQSAVGNVSCEPAAAGPTGIESVLGLPFHQARDQWNDRFEKAYLQARLKASDGVVLRAAEAAEIPRQTFHRLMRKHGM